MFRYVIFFLCSVLVAPRRHCCSSFALAHCLPTTVVTNIWPNFYAWNCFTTCLCVPSFSIYSSLNFPFLPFSYWTVRSVWWLLSKTILICSAFCSFRLFTHIWLLWLLLSQVFFSLHSLTLFCYLYFSFFSIHLVKWFTSPASSSSLFVRHWTINRLCVYIRLQKGRKRVLKYLWLCICRRYWGGITKEKNGTRSFLFYYHKNWNQTMNRPTRHSFFTICFNTALKNYNNAYEKSIWLLMCVVSKFACFFWYFPFYTLIFFFGFFEYPI